jgi:hypothetical protein
VIASWRFIASACRELAVLSLVLCVRCYQWTLSPVLGANCRYTPTCSQYAIDALRRHGPLRGGVKSLRRLARCHPWSAGGYDPA